MKEEKIEREFFDKIGSKYNEDFLRLDKISSHLVKEYHHSKIISEIQLNNSLILEIGCGTGTLMKKLILGSNIVVGLDLSQNLLHEAKKEGLDVVLASSQKLPFINNIFDYLICEDAIHHLPNLEICLKEFFRVFKQDGKIVIFDPNPENPFGNIARFVLKKFNKLTKTERPIRAKVLNEILKTCGYNSIEVQYGSIIAFPLSGMVTGVNLVPSWKRLWATLLKLDEILSWNKKRVSRLFGWKYLTVAKKLGL